MSFFGEVGERGDGGVGMGERDFFIGGWGEGEERFVRGFLRWYRTQP